MLAIDSQKIKQIAEKYELDLVVLFGSQATGLANTKSDVDLAVAGSQAEVLDGLLKITSDFCLTFSREDVEVVSLASAAPTLWQAVTRDGKLLYEKSPGYFWRWKVYAWKIWLETAWLRKIRDQRLLNWATKQAKT